jgi:flagellum-specific ATP synthase
MHNVISRGQFEMARRFRTIYSRFQKSRDLVRVGAYVSGSDPALDQAIGLEPSMRAFLQQDMREGASFAQSMDAMMNLLNSDAG